MGKAERRAPYQATQACVNSLLHSRSTEAVVGNGTDRKTANFHVLEISGALFEAKNSLFLFSPQQSMHQSLCHPKNDENDEPTGDAADDFQRRNRRFHSVDDPYREPEEDAVDQQDRERRHEEPQRC